MCCGNCCGNKVELKISEEWVVGMRGGEIVGTRMKYCAEELLWQRFVCLVSCEMK